VKRIEPTAAGRPRSRSSIAPPKPAVLDVIAAVRLPVVVDETNFHYLVLTAC
jgi:hypothetical protein